MIREGVTAVHREMQCRDRRNEGRYGLTWDFPGLFHHVYDAGILRELSCLMIFLQLNCLARLILHYFLKEYHQEESLMRFVLLSVRGHR